MPAVRSVISAPAGVAGMPMASFLLWTALGSLLWTSALTGVGYALEARYEQVARWLDPVTHAVLALALVAYVWRLVKVRRTSRS